MKRGREWNGDRAGDEQGWEDSVSWLLGNGGTRAGDGRQVGGLGDGVAVTGQ